MNANDRRYFNHQYNVIPVAAAKNMGIIAMKVFADGAMYGKDNHFSRQPADVVRNVGSPAIPSAPLVRYSLSTPGISTAIIGIGHIDKDRNRDQLEQNLAVSRLSGQMDGAERKRIEQLAARAKNGMTNYFQRKAEAPVMSPAQCDRFPGNAGGSTSSASGLADGLCRRPAVESLRNSEGRIS